MNRFCFYITFIIIIGNSLLLHALNSGQIISPTYRIYAIDIKSDSTQYRLPDSLIIINSEKVNSEGNILERNTDYTLDYISGIITFKALDKLTNTVYVSYNITPEFLLNRMYLYELISIRDSLGELPITRKFSLNQPDNKLLITGAKTFSLSFSNQESFDMKQSLYLKLEGEVSHNMRIEGQLSDSQSPLTPEGDSKEISSLDKVYLRLYGNQYDIILGDQEWQYKDTALMNYQTRFEGLNLIYHGAYGMQAAIAADGGKQASNIFQGIDGKQGPYYLTANNTEQNIMVVPGSERISINGDGKERGSDYYIDYSEGSVTFKTLITSNSRIFVDFQYTDDYYNQNLYLNSSEFNITNSIRLRHRMIWQVDDKNNPLQTIFSHADKDSLRYAGDNTVWGQGIIEVASGQGQYIRKIDSNNRVYYQYAANDTTANYVIYFSYVGYGKGDYEQFSTSKFEYKGVGLGSWLPVKRLNAPTEKGNIGLDVDYSCAPFDINLEGMYTNQDKNTFSSKDDNDNQSFITASKISYHPEGIKYEPSLSLMVHHRNKDSFSFSNLTSSSDNYEFSSLPSYDSLAQNLIEFNSQLSEQDFWKQLITMRYKKIESKYTQNAVKLNSILTQKGLIPNVNWLGIYSRQAFNDTTLTNSDLYFHNVASSYKWKFIQMGFSYFYQQDDYTFAHENAVNITGTRYQKYNPSLKAGDDESLNAEISYIKDINAQEKHDKWANTNQSTTLNLTQILNKPMNTVNVNYTHREITKAINDTTDSNQKYDLFDLKSSHQLWDNSLSLLTAYQINQLEFFPQIRELEYIGNGLGLYDSTGVQVSGGDYDYVYTLSGQSKLTTEVTANANIFFHPSPNKFHAAIWKKVQLESGFQISENTLRSNNIKIYLLYPDAIFKKDTTIYGNQSMQHTLWVDILHDIVAGNLKYNLTRTLDNRYQSESRTLNDEKELELDWKNVYGNKIQTSYKNSMEKDTRYNSKITNQSVDAIIFRSINSTTNTQTTLSYSTEEGSEQNQTDKYNITNFQINPLINLYLLKKYRITSSFTAQFNRRKGSDYLSFLPEKRNGSIYIWLMQAQYRINSFTSGSLEYNGKSYPGDKTIHELKMEFRAEL